MMSHPILSSGHPLRGCPLQERITAGQVTRAHLLQESLMLSPQSIPLLGEVLNKILLLPTLCQLPLVQDLALL